VPLARVTIVFGVLLIVLGVIPFAMSGAKTALIPAYVGVVLAVLGAVAINRGARKHAMHAAVIVGLLGFLAAAGRLGSSMSSGKAPSALGATSLGLMALLTLVFVVLCVRSFVQARRQRLAGDRGFEPAVPSGRA
jgi:uncharacterized membrane protein HdeD (DUF308 family)